MLELKIDLFGAEVAPNGEGAVEVSDGTSFEETVLLLEPRPKTLELELEEENMELENPDGGPELVAAGVVVLGTTIEEDVTAPVVEDETTLLAPPMPKILEVMTEGLDSGGALPSFEAFGWLTPKKGGGAPVLLELPRTAEAETAVVVLTVEVGSEGLKVEGGVIPREDVVVPRPKELPILGAVDAEDTTEDKAENPADGAAVVEEVSENPVTELRLEPGGGAPAGESKLNPRLTLLELTVETAGWLKGIALPRVGSAEAVEPRGCVGLALAGEIGSYNTFLGFVFCGVMIGTSEDLSFSRRLALLGLLGDSLG